MAQKKQYVDNDVFGFSVKLMYHYASDVITVYTKPFKPAANMDDYDMQENKVQKAYFTPERIKELKEKFVKKIMESDNPFNIECIDRDGGYEVTKDQLFDIGE